MTEHKRVEFIESYLKIGNDYQWNDNHGELIRCKDCKWFGKIGCAVSIVDDTDKPSENDYCSFAERKEKNDCNDCYYSMQNCNDKSICCEDETALCDNFEPVVERKEK